MAVADAIRKKRRDCSHGRLRFFVPAGFTNQEKIMMTDIAAESRKERTICNLQRIRRANNGMRGCAEILIQHSVNKESANTSPGAYIVLTVQQEAFNPR